MGRTPDRFHGPSFEEGVIWTEETSSPSEDRRQQYVQNKGLEIFEDGVARGLGESRVNIFQYPCDDRDVDDPPDSPATGYRVVIGASPTGDFSGHAGEVVQWNGTAWVFTTPKQGMLVYVNDESNPYKQTSASSPWVWVKATLTESEHRVLRQLIHFISEGPAEGFVSGAYKETLPSGSIFPTSVIWWESSSKLNKIVERNLTWSGVNVTVDEWKGYDTDGSTVLGTVSDAISYSGIVETSRIRTITVS